MNDEHKKTPKESIKKIVSKLDEEKNKTLKKLDLISDDRTKWVMIGEAYEFDKPHIEPVGAVYGSADNVILNARERIEQIKPGELTIGLLINIRSSGDAVMGMMLAANATTPHLPLEIAKKLLDETSGFHKRTREEILSFLKSFAPHLVYSFKEAWSSFERGQFDPERGASGLMREVVNQTIQILAPKEVKTRAERIEYIAKNFAKNDDSKTQIKNISKSYIETIDALNKVHKPSKLNKDEVESLLYASENLLSVLANNIDLNKRK